MKEKLKVTLTELLHDAGYRIEGPGGSSDRELAGRYWWTLFRDGWSGVECGPHFRSAEQARADAVAAMLADDDLDWEACIVMENAVRSFPADFGARMARAT